MDHTIQHIDANYIDDTYMLHNDTTVYGEPNPILPIAAILFLIISSLCCSYQGGQVFMSDFINRNRTIQPINNNKDEINTYLIKQTINQSDLDLKECCICLEKLDYSIVLECKHSFHTHCILSWFEKELSCPLCRSRVYLNK